MLAKISSALHLSNRHDSDEKLPNY